MNYDPVTYWNNRPNPNASDSPYVGSDIKKLWGWIPVGSKVFDFGPGVGKTFPAYTGALYVMGYDVSAAYDERAKDSASTWGLFYESVIDKSPTLPDGFTDFFKDYFDVAVAYNVFTHQKPEHIEQIMLNLSNIAKNVVSMSWQSERDVTPAPHCFNRNYIELCDKLGLNIVYYELNDEKLFLVYNGGRHEV